MLVLRHIIFNGFDTRTLWAHTHSISSGFCRWICFSSFVGSFVRLWEHSAIALEYHTWASLDIFFRSMYSDNARRLVPFHFIVFIVSFQSHLHRGTRLEALCLALLCFALAWLTVQFTHSKKRERHSYTKQAIKPASYACTAQHSTATCTRIHNPIFSSSSSLQTILFSVCSLILRWFVRSVVR